MGASAYNKLFMAQINKITTELSRREEGRGLYGSEHPGKLSWGRRRDGSMRRRRGERQSFIHLHEKGELRRPVFVAYESGFNTIDPDIINDEPPAQIPIGKLLTQLEYFPQPEGPKAQFTL